MSQARPTNEEMTARAPQSELPGALTVAMRQILGTILVDSSLWQEVQKKLRPDDFPQGVLRNLAGVIWQRLQDEGELEFSNFLTDLGDPDLVGLAIELTETVEQLPEMNKTLDGALEFIAQERQRGEQRQLHREAGRNVRLQLHLHRRGSVGAAQKGAGKSQNAGYPARRLLIFAMATRGSQVRLRAVVRGAPAPVREVSSRESGATDGVLVTGFVIFHETLARPASLPACGRSSAALKGFWRIWSLLNHP